MNGDVLEILTSPGDWPGPGWKAILVARLLFLDSLLLQMVGSRGGLQGTRALFPSTALIQPAQSLQASAHSRHALGFVHFIVICW